MSEINLVTKVKAFIDDLAKQGGKPLYELTPEEARDVLIAVQKTPADRPEMSFEDVRLPIDDEEHLTVRIVRPLDVSEPLPIIYYIHGGGWVMGNVETHDRLIRELAEKTKAAVVFPVYLPSPEAQFPRPLEELFATLVYVYENASTYNLDPSRLVVAGDSVGGNMATVMAMMAKENGNMPKIAAQLLLYPVTNDDFNTESYQQFADGPWLTKKAMEWFWDAYAPNKNDRSKITACPLKAPIKTLKDLPPALILTAENDVLRDEGEAYARKLDEAGVAVVNMRVNGTIHDFMMLNALADTKPTRAAIEMAVAFLKGVLH